MVAILGATMMVDSVEKLVEIRQLEVTLSLSIARSLVKYNTTPYSEFAAVYTVHIVYCIV